MTESILWPNQQDYVDGVVPTEEVSQDPDLYKDDEDEETSETEA